MSSRINDIEALINLWPRVAEELKLRQANLIERLITSENEETRGAIKELRYLIDLPSVLQYERDHLAAGLSDSSDPA